VLERLTLLRDADLTGIEDPCDLVRGGYCDAVRLFVKQEPHKISKLRDGRVRLIFSVSLVDNLVARLLCTLQNSTEINNWATIPSKPGLSLADAGQRILYRNVLLGASGGSIAEADVSGWDWCFQESDFLADLERRLDLCSGRGTVFERILRNHFHCMARKVVVLSDGSMYSQGTPGVLPSGWYNTSGTNSYVCVLHGHMVAAVGNVPRPWAIGMGDDTIQRYVPGAVDTYKRFGKRLKMYNAVTPSQFEFCSTQWMGSEYGFPVNVDKMLCKLLMNPPIDDFDFEQRLGQFSFEVRHLHPKELELAMNLIGFADWGVEELWEECSDHDIC